MKMATIKQKQLHTPALLDLYTGIEKWKNDPCRELKSNPSLWVVEVGTKCCLISYLLKFVS